MVSDVVNVTGPATWHMRPELLFSDQASIDEKSKPPVHRELPHNASGTVVQFGAAQTAPVLIQKTQQKQVFAV